MALVCAALGPGEGHMVLVWLDLRRPLCARLANRIPDASPGEMLTPIVDRMDSAACLPYPVVRRRAGCQIPQSSGC